MRKEQLLILLILFVSVNTTFAQKLKEKNELDVAYTFFAQKRDSLVGLMKNLSEKIHSTTNEEEKKKYQSLVNRLEEEIDVNREEELLCELEFVRKNPSSHRSLDILVTNFYRSKAIRQLPAFAILFQQLTPTLQNSEKGKTLQKEINYYNGSKVGSIAPLFSVMDFNQQTLSLESFRDKQYILIDFWASWCVPCRADFPSLIQLYRKYHDKGLEIINVSRDSNLEHWRMAIKKDGIDIWKHFAIKENRIPLESLYFVSAIPVKVLIDKQGKIIARWHGGGEENLESLKEALAAIFD